MLSSRAKHGNAWFLEHFKRPLNRQGSKSASSIDLATAENWLFRPEILPILKRNIQSGLTAEHLSYAGGLGGSPELLGAVSAFFNHFFLPKVPVEPEHVVTGAGCSAILDTLIHDICDDGDGLLVAAPMWGSFEISAVMRNGVKIIPVSEPAQETDSAQAIVAAYQTAANQAAASGTRIRGLLFCNPHNPHGHVCTVEVLDALLRFCEEADIHFLSDEIYALSTFGRIDAQAAGEPNQRGGKGFASPSARFVSVLSRDLKKLGVDRSRIHILYSISKDFGCSGLRLGCLVTQGNKELRMSQAILNNARLSTATAVMAAPLLHDIPNLTTLVDLNIRRLRRAAQIAIQFAEFHGLTYYTPVAGLYIWLRLSPDGCESRDEEEDMVRRCAEHGVLIGCGADYAQAQAGWFRLTFALPEHVFLEALRRVEAVVGYAERFRFEDAGRDMGGKSMWTAAFSVLCRGLSFRG